MTPPPQMPFLKIIKNYNYNYKNLNKLNLKLNVKKII
jgi:hypothetical protein